MMSAFREIGTESCTPRRRRSDLPSSKQPAARTTSGTQQVSAKVRQSIAGWIAAVGLAIAVGVLAATCLNRALLQSNQAPAPSPRQHAGGPIRGCVGTAGKSSVDEPASKVVSLRRGPSPPNRVEDALQLTSYFGHEKESKWTKSLEWEDTSTKLAGPDSIVPLPAVEEVEVHADVADDKPAESKSGEVNKAGRPSDLKSPICRLAAVPSAEAELVSAIQLPASPATEASRSPALAAQPEEIASPQPALEIDSRPVRSMTIDIRARGGAVPDNLAREQLSRMQTLSDTASLREWSPFAYQWEAPGMCHQPLYFEEVSLERLGRRPIGPRFIQPAISAAHFFGTVPLLPYAIATNPPSVLVYTLGEYRPGSDVPCDLRRPPFSLRGLSVQSAAVTGLILMIP